MKGVDILSTLLKPHDALRIMWYLQREARNLNSKCQTLFPDTGTPRVDMCFYPKRWLKERDIDPHSLTECVMLASEAGMVFYFVSNESIQPILTRGRGDGIQCICFLV